MTGTQNPTANLEFSNLDEVIDRLEQYHRDGYRSSGKWNMAQTCEHLSDWMGFMIDGYPIAPLPVRMMLGAIRVTMGRSMMRKILTNGKMSAGSPTMPQTVHGADGLVDEVSLQRFRETVKRFQAHSGDYCTSPLFGKFSAEQGRAMQLVHCAHHLNFLQPKSPVKAG